VTIGSWDRERLIRHQGQEQTNDEFDKATDATPETGYVQATPQLQAVLSRKAALAGADYARSEVAMRQKILIALAALVSADMAAAQEIKVRCPTEGMFDAPRELGDMPNPAAGWQTFLEGTPRKVELVPPTGPGGWWLITCYLDVGGALVPINALLSGTRKCQLTGNGGSITPLPNKGQSCMIGAGNDSCLITCR
jgi:hypothetical protein